MRASLNWLKQYVDITIGIDDLAARLTMAGLEIESIENLGEKYKGFIIAEVLEVTKHPKADKLSVCRVNPGGPELQIVCGAPNVAAGQRVILGTVGAVVPHDQHDPEGKPFTLTKAKIRGVESFGMICSASELGLGDDKDGIMVLQGDGLTLGTPLADYLGLNDTAFEVGITPNRPDAMSHIGLARDIASITGEKLRLPAVDIKEDSRVVSDAAKIVLEDPVNCPRYSARVVMGVTIAESPRWLRNFLQAAGVRPVNNVVDITNYVLMECGQPIHAFDYDKLAGHTIIVRQAREGEPFTTLDHKERKLRADSLMICDGERPVAIAGVMGGLNSEISESTQNVLIESAYFKPASVRRTSKHFGLSTDASQRFERGTDPAVTAWAADRVASLIQSICGGAVLKGLIDEYPVKIEPRVIKVRPARANAILGTAIPPKDMPGMLTELGMAIVTTEADSFTVAVPTFRPDIEREIDLIEEIARIYGYDNIDTNVRTSMSLAESIPAIPLTTSFRDWMVGRGFNEVVSNSMTPKSIAVQTSDTPVEVANPISKDMATLRTSISTSLLQIIRNNIFHGTPNLRLFEIGKVYFRNPDADPGTLAGYTEETRLAIAISGMTLQKNWAAPAGQESDFYDLKGELEALSKKNSLDKFKFIPYTTGNALTDLGLSIEINGASKGYLGRVREDVLKGYDIGQPVYIAEVTLDGVVKATQKKYSSLPVYPSVHRDLALVMDETTEVQPVMDGLREAGGALVTSVELFDIYRGNQVDTGKKSCAFALRFQSPERTLSVDEIDAVMKRITGHAATKFNAIVRM